MYQEEITGVRGEAPQEKNLGHERASEAPFPWHFAKVLRNCGTLEAKRSVVSGRRVRQKAQRGLL